MAPPSEDPHMMTPPHMVEPTPVPYPPTGPNTPDLMSQGHPPQQRRVSSLEQENVRTQLQMLEDLKRLTKEQDSSKRSKKKAARQQPVHDWILESEITEKDVICERGGKSNRHGGTKRYRGMIEKNKKTYQDLTAKADKTNLSRKIIGQIQKSGGRFLKKDEESNQYYVLSPVETTKKVSQALREKKVLKWTEA